MHEHIHYFQSMKYIKIVLASLLILTNDYNMLYKINAKNAYIQLCNIL